MVLEKAETSPDACGRNQQEPSHVEPPPLHHSSGFYATLLDLPNQIHDHGVKWLEDFRRKGFGAPTGKQVALPKKKESFSTERETETGEGPAPFWSFLPGIFRALSTFTTW